MEPFPRLYTIRVQGNLGERWKDWFAGMSVTNLESGEAVLQGYITDQSILVGIINQIHSLNLKLISVCSENLP